MTVQTGAVTRNLGDLSATDRPSASDPGGLIFDLVAMAAKLPGASTAKVNSVDASTGVEALATPPAADAALPAVAILKPSLVANSLEALDAEAAPVSVDALVTMDKTAKQGLESKAFSPKPETEWSVNIMPAAAAKPVVELVPLTISTFKKADNTSVEQTSIETQAPLVASESPAVAETTSVGAAETKAVTSSAPAAIDEKQTIEAQQPSSVSAAPPAIAIETEIAAALPVPMAVSKPLATMPIEPTPVVSIPNAPVIVQNKTAIVPDAPALAPNPLLELAPLQKPIALPNTPVPTSLTASSLPVTPDVIAPSTKAEQPKTVLAPPDVVLADTPPVS